MPIVQIPLAVTVAVVRRDISAAIWGAPARRVLLVPFRHKDRWNAHHVRKTPTLLTLRHVSLVLKDLVRPWAVPAVSFRP